MLSKLDLDGDGKISLKEFYGLIDLRMEQMQLSLGGYMNLSTSLPFFHPFLKM